MSNNDKPYEERLLDFKRQISQPEAHQKKFQGPLRVIRFCVLGILLPCMLLVIVLCMRYRVYVEQMYPLAASDMRMLDNRVSTTWCQRQMVKVNATFNAFLLPDVPQIEQDTKHLTMVRHLLLEDDSKEYWGFYLLRGSNVTISSCVRWPGASLIVIRGHKHLHECAYIGDNSSEELDELMEAIAEGTYVEPNATLSDAPSNTPNLMKRHRQEVEFHHPHHKNSTKLSDYLDTTDITDPKEIENILKELSQKTNKREKANVEATTKKPHAHVHRNSTFGRGETKNFLFEVEKRKETAEEILNDVLVRLKDLGDEGKDVLRKLNDRFQEEGIQNDQSIGEHVLNVRGRHYSKPVIKYDDSIDRAKRRRRELLRTVMEQSLTEHDQENDAAIEEGLTPDGIADHRGTIDEHTLNDKSNSEFWSSFSSSEEALLNCAGLILNLPLTPHKSCSNSSSPQKIEEAYLANTITYTVPVNGYYFFVFNSENEVQTNYIRVRFNLNKKVYNVSNPVSTCQNVSDFCAMNLNFFSGEKLVMELPVVENEDLWNQEYVVISQCEPRTMIYIVFVVAIPILIMLFAFQ